MMGFDGMEVGRGQVGERGEGFTGCGGGRGDGWTEWGRWGGPVGGARAR